MGSTEDHYVSGGVNWSAFSLEKLVSMVADKASVPQLERLADDWRETGAGVVAAADYLAEALDDLMNYWSGASAEQARHTVALNAQWVSDLGATAKEMGDPIDEAAGALKSAQEAMPELPAAPGRALPGSAPRGAEEAARVTEGSQLAAALGATAAGSESALAAHADQEELKRIAVETMERFEAAVLGIDQATPQFQGLSTVLRPRVDQVDPISGGDDEQWAGQVNSATGVDARWQVLTGMTDASAAGHRLGGSLGDLGGGGFSGGGAVGGGGAGVGIGPVAGGGTIGDVPNRAGAPVGRAGLPGGALGATPGMAGPIGAPMAGMGAQGGEQQHRRRVPVDGEDPFDTGEKASKPVIGL